MSPRVRLARALGRRDLGRLVAVAAVVAPVLFATALAWAARPGGGGSYSGGGSSGSRSSGGGGYGGGGGSSGDGEAIAYLIVLCFEHPVIGIPLLLLFLGFLYMRHRSQSEFKGSEWSAGSPAFTPAFDPPPRRQPVRGKLATIRRMDPAFSIVVFEDFLYFLYAEVHRARGTGAIDGLAAYLSDAARATLRNDGSLAEVTGIVIGGMRYEGVAIDPFGAVQVTVVIEANYVERYRPQGERRYYVEERLSLTRAAGARSRPPDKARILTCPNCGGPVSQMRGTTCQYCKATVPAGSKDWAIAGVQVLAREERGPLLTSNVAEQGTNLPTLVDPNAHASFAQIQAKDPSLTWDKLQHRVGLVFQEFHAGWVGRDPARVRPFVSDNFFQSQLYWIDLYRAARCINRTDGARITRIELASATTDAYFDAVTVRVHATGLDYTISEDGKLLSGSKTTPRPYTEYWTLIRGAQKKQTDKGERQCPSCGAPLSINMAGNCQYCGVKVTSGEYDWVLSRIEQDEAYTG